MAITERLYQFETKSPLINTDIIYCADSANSFNEVQTTVDGLIGAYPALISIGSLTTTANEIIYTTGSNIYATSAVSAFGLSVIALSAGVTTPTAGDFATWDASSNLSSNNFLAGFQAIVAAAGNTVLVIGSPQTTQITGSTTQTVTMPVVSTLKVGTPYKIINSSTGAVTVNSSGGNLIQTVAPGTTLELVSILNSGTSAASWYSDGLNGAFTTFVPTFTCASPGDLSVSYSLQVGAYRIVGNIVFYRWVVTSTPTYTTATGTVYITGAPIAANSQTYITCTGSGIFNGAGISWPVGASYIIPTIAAGESQWSMTAVIPTGATGGTQIDISNIPSGQQAVINGTGFYFI